MNATLLASAAAICAVLGFGLALVVHIIKYSYAEGQKDQRLKALEERPHDGDCKAELAVLTAKFAVLEKTITDVAHDVKNLLTGQVVPRRRSGNDA